MNTQKYCKHCGQLIDKDCVICVHCGKQVEELKSNSDKNIYINNSASAAASSAVSMPEKRTNLFFHNFLTIQKEPEKNMKSFPLTPAILFFVFCKFKTNFS